MANKKVRPQCAPECRIRCHQESSSSLDNMHAEGEEGF